MKKYIVVERTRSWDSFNLVNEDTTALNDIWETHVPYKLDEDKKSNIKPLIFDNRPDALKYKNKHQSDSDRDWRENDWIYRRYGDSKPKWKVEVYSGNLFR